jgi:hypothetical protein
MFFKLKMTLEQAYSTRIGKVRGQMIPVNHLGTSSPGMQTQNLGIGFSPNFQ